jgi:hypothetical protein
MSHAVRPTILLLGALMLASVSTSAAALQTQDTTYARLIRENTSDSRFMPASLARLPEHATIPSPRDHFGTIIGAPGVMHRTAEVHGYYRALAAATPRLRFETLGRSEEVATWR